MAPFINNNQSKVLFLVCFTFKVEIVLIKLLHFPFVSLLLKADFMQSRGTWQSRISVVQCNIIVPENAMSRLLLFL